jgi:hypothetical protein
MVLKLNFKISFFLRLTLQAAGHFCQVKPNEREKGSTIDLPGMGPTLRVKRVLGREMVAEVV